MAKYFRIYLCNFLIDVEQLLEILVTIRENVVPIGESQWQDIQLSLDQVQCTCIIKNTVILAAFKENMQSKIIPPMFRNYSTIIKSM